MTIDDLIEAAKIELASLTNEEKQILYGGFDNRGLDCISERWYAPDRLRDGAIGKLGSLIFEAKCMLEEIEPEESDYL